MNTTDCRNMACPAPVVAAKNVLEESGTEEVELLVDEGAARENVTRFAANRGYGVVEKQLDKGFSLRMKKISDVDPHKHPDPVKSGETVILITSDRLGDGPDELGRLLMKNFIITLLELPDLPSRMIFLNSAINLTAEGSELVTPLLKLEAVGVEILSCGLCLDFYHKKDKLEVGRVTNMFTIAESLIGAGSVIQL